LLEKALLGTATACGEAKSSRLPNEAKFAQKFRQSSPMWTAGKDEWNRYLAEYGRALETVPATPPRGRNPKSLAEWESYVWEELPETLSQRDPAYITQEELSNITTWKLKRGKWRPRLQALVNGNDDEAVREASADAFEHAEADPGAAIDALCGLKGVGPATSAAVLAILRSDVAFMSDELLLAIPKLNGQLKYTKKVFLTLLDESRKKAAELGEDWTPKKVERACFAHARLVGAEDMKPDVAVEKTEEPKPLGGAQDTKEDTEPNDSSEEKDDVAQRKPAARKRGRKAQMLASDGAKPSAAKKAKAPKKLSTEKSDTVEPKTMPSKRGRPAKNKGKEVA
jgi:hypothetical protein